MMKMLKSDLVVRAERTFAQAFVAQLALASNPTTSKAVVAAAAAALSLTYNRVVRPALDKAVAKLKAR